MPQIPADKNETPTPQLTPDESARLMEDPPLSLDQDDEILASWIEEAERRGDEYERGEMGAIDFDEAIALARARIASFEREIARRAAQLDSGEVETEPVKPLIAELHATAQSSSHRHKK
ncbi:addiction module protein [Azonexus sp.]|uniref:addiction module protein n=1 Tax=Azonexus sp. TaxID=1872668 RepID=UPI0035B32351